MVLAVLSPTLIMDLENGLVYSRGNISGAVDVYRDGVRITSAKGEYAQALWVYLESKLTVSPELYPIKE